MGQSDLQFKAFLATIVEDLEEIKELYSNEQDKPKADKKIEKILNRLNETLKA
jgi:hypothetical protein